jgi:hypothetical protein
MISTSDSYAAFGRRLEGIFFQTLQLPPGFLGYSQSDILLRLTQCCASRVFEFTQVAAEIYRKTGSLPADDVQVIFGGIYINSDGSIRLLPKKLLKLFIRFFTQWIYILVKILTSLRMSAVHRQETLLYGVGSHDLIVEGSDERFLNFCLAGPILPLATASHIFIQATHGIDSMRPDYVKFCRNPLLMAMSHSGLSLRVWTYALAQHLLAMGSYFRALYYCPAMLLLGDDIAIHATAATLNRERLIRDVIFTNSNYDSQPLWFWALPNRTYSSHIVWYSQNHFPISYEDESQVVPFPNLRYIRADVQWVWSEGFKDFLSGLCPKCSYKVVGPIVWHLRTRLIQTRGKTKKITLFDVTPITEEAEKKFGLLRNLFSEKNVSMFIQDTVDVAEALSQETGIEIEVVLKHKRLHTNIHSSEYIQKISYLVDAGAIKLIEPSYNLYDLILDSDVVIVFPYSSAIYLSKKLGKEAFWYDPTTTLEWKHGILEFPLVKGKNSLAKQIRKVMVND